MTTARVNACNIIILTRVTRRTWSTREPPGEIIDVEREYRYPLSCSSRCNLLPFVFASIHIAGRDNRAEIIRCETTIDESRARARSPMRAVVFNENRRKRYPRSVTTGENRPNKREGNRAREREGRHRARLKQAQGARRCLSGSVSGNGRL